MRRWFCAIWIIFFALSGGRAFSASLEDFNFLNDIKAFTSEKEVRLSIDFKSPIKNYNGPIFYEKSIQIDFQDAYLHPAKRTFQVGDDLIQEILAYQFKKDVVRVRFVLAHSQYDLDKNFTLEASEGKMIFSLKKLPSDPLAKLIETIPIEAKETKAPAESGKAVAHAIQETIEPAAASIDKGKEKKESYAGSGVLPDTLLESQAPAKEGSDQGSPNSEPGSLELQPGEDTPDLFSATVKIYGALLVVLAVFLVLFYFAKNYFFQGSWILNKDKLIDVIATNHLGAKKCISIVEVAGEVLVLGVSNNHISMLTRIEDMDTIANLKKYKARFPKANPLGGFKFPFSFSNKGKTASPDSNFSSHLKDFTSDLPEPEFSETIHTAADVTRLIQERLGRSPKSEKMDYQVESVG